jgi:hypothetical protein
LFRTVIPRWIRKGLLLLTLGLIIDGDVGHTLLPCAVDELKVGAVGIGVGVVEDTRWKGKTVLSRTVTGCADD